MHCIPCIQSTLQSTNRHTVNTTINEHTIPDSGKYLNICIMINIPFWTLVTILNIYFSKAEDALVLATKSDQNKGQVDNQQNKKKQ